MATTDEISAAPPCVAERYAGAVSTSNLTAPEDWRPTDAYMIVASGLSRKGIGGALMRLRTEWERTAKPHRGKALTVAEYAARLPLVKVREVPGPWVGGLTRTERGPDIERAKAMQAEAIAAVSQWYDAEIKMLKNRMRDMPAVRDHLGVWRYGEPFLALRDELAAFPERVTASFEQVDNLVAETVLWWLDDTCTACHGSRWLMVPNTNRLSNRVCPKCKGTGKKREPTGEGQLMLDYMHQCVFDWRQSTSAQLSTMNGRKLQPRNK